ncbi:MAG: hypothetical protein D6772_08220, partial [Bacteroidetes bacterium]
GIPDLTNNYGLRLLTPEGGLQACDSAQIEARLINLGPRESSELEYALLSLPAAYDYVPGSHSGTTAPEDNSLFDDRRILRFPIPPGLPPGDSLSFRFQLADLREELLACTDQEMTISSVLKTKVACGLNPADSCDVLLILNSDTLQVAQQKDQFTLTEIFHEATVVDDARERVRTHLCVNNTDTRFSRSDTLVWEIYYDQNGDGIADPTQDVLLHQDAPRFWRIPGGSSIIDSLTYTINYAQACQLIAVLRNPNQSCFCEPLLSLALTPPILRNAGPDRSVCSGDRVWLGEDGRSGELEFQWRSNGVNPPELLQPDSAFTEFRQLNHSSLPHNYTVELVTTRAGLCTTVDTTEVTVWAALRPNAIVSSDYHGAQISCYGAADGEITARVDLATSPVSYTLAGRTQYQPIFTALPAGSYPVSYLDAQGCRAQDTVLLSQPDSLV